MLEFCKHLHKHSHISWQITTRFKTTPCFHHMDFTDRWTTQSTLHDSSYLKYDTKNNGLRRSKRTLYKTKLLAPAAYEQTVHINRSPRYSI